MPEPVDDDDIEFILQPTEAVAGDANDDQALPSLPRSDNIEYNIVRNIMGPSSSSTGFGESFSGVRSSSPLLPAAIAANLETPTRPPLQSLWRKLINIVREGKAEMEARHDAIYAARSAAGSD